MRIAYNPNDPNQRPNTGRPSTSSVATMGQPNFAGVPQDRPAGLNAMITSYAAPGGGRGPAPGFVPSQHNMQSGMAPSMAPSILNMDPSTLNPTTNPQQPGTGIAPQRPQGPTVGRAPQVGQPNYQQVGANVSAFGPGNDLRFQQIGPGQSPQTQQAQGFAQNAAQQYANVQFSPFQTLQTPTFDQSRGMVQGANAQMQNLGYNWGGANSQYGNAQAQQAGAQGQAQSILSQLMAGGMDFSGGGAQANTGRFNQELDAALEGLQGPDRAQIAADTMGLLEERSRSGFEQAQRQTGQRAAALGRLGSGMTTNDLTGVLQSRENLLDRSRRELALDAASRTLDDRLNVANFQRGVAGDRFSGETFNASLADNAAGRAQQGAMFGANLQRGVAGDLYGMGRDAADLSMSIGDRFGNQARDDVGLGERQADFSRIAAGDLAGFDRDQFAAQRNERDAARADQYDQAGFARNRFGDFADYQNQRENRDQSNRDELRGERAWQYGTGRDAQNDERTRMFDEEFLRSADFGRLRELLGLGMGMPQPNYGGQAQRYDARAADQFGAASEALASLGYGRQRRQA